MHEVQLRFIEIKNDSGQTRRILQYRNAPYHGWMDVPCYTFEQQEADSREAEKQAEELGSYG